jgi:hypothetical protein
MAVRRLDTKAFAELDIVSALARTGDPTFGDHHEYRTALSRHRGRLADVWIPQLANQTYLELERE